MNSGGREDQEACRDRKNDRARRGRWRANCKVSSGVVTVLQIHRRCSTTANAIETSSVKDLSASKLSIMQSRPALENL